jgi:glycolate oxidase iron-sulfur subunit
MRPLLATRRAALRGVNASIRGMSVHPPESASRTASPLDSYPTGTAESHAPGVPPAADPRLQELADQCVMCGLCLPHCPTYRISLDEAESPRGRIALARSLATGRIQPSPTALAHLDQCLACLSCQKVCPSEVRYGEIITRSRAALAVRRPQPGFVRRLLNDPDRLVALARIGASLRIVRWARPLARWLPRTSRWRAIVEQIPDAPATMRSLRQSDAATDRGRVTLFRGCVASVYDRDTHAAARRILEALGYEVRVPAGTPCCGALARHAGDVVVADRQSSNASAALEEAGGDTVLVSATGCFGDLRDHASKAGGSKITDIHAFLARDERLTRLRFRPLVQRAALHLPCTQVNVVGEIDSIRALLARIPGLTVLSLPEQPRCCGAAGSYFIEHPAIADRLRAEKLEQIATQQPDLLLTTNIGCRIHLGNGLRDVASKMPVLHPLALLAQQLENDNP